MSERRYLLGILVYNGRTVVPPCLESASRVVSDRVDVVVFDDCSPSEGWSEEVRSMCSMFGIGYYRTPRNLGIPRNMSLLMRTAVEGGYDVAGLINSDVVLPTNIVECIDGVLDAHPDAGSITPWSNNVSAFSLPMQGASPDIADGEFVSQLSRALLEVNGTQVHDVPTGVGYCLMIPTDVIRAVGVMDPIFGRGYCEEVDWCQRAHIAGFRNVLSLGSYVYHAGSGTNADEGLLAHGMTTIIEHELIVRGRYTDYEARVAEFFADTEFGPRARSSLRDALLLMMGERGYDLVLGEPLAPPVSSACLLTLSARGDSTASIALCGISAVLDVGATHQQFIERMGPPRSLTVIEPGAHGDQLASWARANGVPVVQYLGYPTRA